MEEEGCTCRNDEMTNLYFISLIALINVMAPFGPSSFTSELGVGVARAAEISDTTSPKTPSSLINEIVPKVMPSPGEGSPLKVTIKNGTDAFKAGSAAYTKIEDDYKKLENDYYRNLGIFSDATRIKKEAALETAKNTALTYAQQLRELASVLNMLVAVDKLQEQYDDARIPVKTEGGICKENCTSEKGCRWKKKAAPVGEIQ